ncbi:MAG: pyridoxal-phosphate dependent enzyme [Candidatus Daviesbacteria bacterium]|nr:MAG: pyridoxal-phosphate dependent enzyme [Candidatus Daviesbacteria bacterium]
MSLSPDREQLFKEVTSLLHYQAEVYPLGERFTSLPENLANIVVLDVTKVPGCHYGLKNVFVPIIRNLEETRDKGRTRIAPDNAILVEPSTGNGWTAFSDAAEALGYEHIVVMPGGLPEARYKHLSGRSVTIIKTPKELYAEGMPVQVKALVDSNLDRIRRKEKIYASPNHAVSAGDITVATMVELGKQLVDQLQPKLPLTVIASMGNGASVCALGEYVKANTKNARMIATESFAYGGGYDWFARLNHRKRYKDAYGIQPGNRTLLAEFSTYGTNAPIGIELPLQTRAIEGGLLDDYALFTDKQVMRGLDRIPFMFLRTWWEWYQASLLPNYSKLPQSLIDTYGNSTLANIAVAERVQKPGRITVAMAYDGRGNY